MSGRCIVLSLSTNLHQVWRQPFTCIVVVDWSVVYLCVWQRNSQESRRQGSKREHARRPATVRYRVLSDPSCSIVTSRPVTNGLIGAAVACARLLTAGSMSSDSTTSLSTPPVCAGVDVEMRFGAAGSGGAGCPSWALASTGPSSPVHKRSNRARHRSVCC